jgi:uncharacterized integral membrane protein
MSTEPPVSASEPTPPGPPASPAPPAPPVDTPKTPAQPVSEVGFTRAAALWSAIFLGLLILIVLLIFVAQNTESASFAFLGWHWTLPLGVAILGAAVGGGLIAVLGGAARIFQLRRAAKKNLKAALKS